MTDIRDVIAALKRRGYVIRRRGDGWAVRGVWPALLTEYSLRALLRGLEGVRE